MRLRAAGLLLLVAAACGGGSDANTEQPVPTLRPGAVVDTTPEGFRSILASMIGTPVVVNYWATWCEPCRREMPRFVEAAATYGGRVAFLGVDVEDDPEAADAFLRRHGIPFASVGDPKGDIKRAEQIVGLPTTQFFRADGELAFVHSGEISAEDLSARIEELIRVGKPATPPAGTPDV